MNALNGHKDFAPPASDPVRLAGMTIKAVDQICEMTAKEIEATADEVTKAAEVVAANLHQLAGAFREQGIIAAGHLTEFITKTNAALESVRAIQDAMDHGKRKNGTADEVADNDKPIPTFLQQSVAIS